MHLNPELPESFQFGWLMEGDKILVRREYEMVHERNEAERN